MTDEPLSGATRRTVLATSAVAAVAMATVPVDAYASPLPRRARWEKLVGRTFVASRNGRRIKLRLDAVEDGPLRPRGLGRRARRRWRESTYVLRFSTGSRPGQGTWTLRHASTGGLRVFVVPGQVQRGRRTVANATFNGWRG